MKIYFLSSLPCSLKINGAFFGVSDRFPRYTNLDLRDGVFVEFLPENALPVTFFLTENIRFSSPRGCHVYILSNGIAVYAVDFISADFTLQTLWQKRIEDCLLTVFLQGRLQLAVQTPDDVFTLPLPDKLTDFDGEIYQNYLLFHGDLGDEKRLFVFYKGAKVLDEPILSYRLEKDVLHVEKPLLDRLNRTASQRWILQENGLLQTEFTVQQTGNNSTQPPRAELLSYAFFEGVLLGVNYADFLCDELVASADKIVAYLGDFIGVTLTDDPLVCGLIRRKGERLFSLSYYQTVVENGKIVDVRG